MIDVRLFHHRQELARIGGERFDVASLPFGVECVKGQRRFARPREAGDDNQFVSGNIQVNVLEVVGARTAHLDGIHSSDSLKRC